MGGESAGWATPAPVSSGPHGTARTGAGAAPRELRLLVFATAGVLAAGGIVALAVFAATRTPSPTARPIVVGEAADRRAQIREGGPIYVADPTGGRGLWLDLEDGRLVALAVDLPGRPDCIVKWRATRSAYVACDGRRLRSTDLDRYASTIQRSDRPGRPKGAWVVDLTRRLPAPDAAAPRRAGTSVPTRR